ncbi:MAG TPA: GYD domain-containing protein [Stellaceae bacterium]|nr:GYD domain-containing protein [Stellaceae bacterium]
MPKYLVRVSYTAEGVKGLEKDKASGRRAAVAKLLESDGGKLEAFYFAFGADDVISIVDVPSNTAAAAFSLAVNAAGLAKLSLTPLLTVEEMDAAIGKSVTYRPPGR